MAPKQKIQNILDNPDSGVGKLFAFTVQFLIVVSLITFSIDTLPNLSADTKRLLRYIEATTISIFTVEYIFRVWVADNKLKFIFSFYGLVDLIAIIPFYISSGLDLRTVRTLRFLRLVRILKLFKYSKAINRFRRALLIAKEELILFGFITLIMLYLSSVGIYYFEHQAQPDQ